jgi:hypothetical protein
MRSLHKGAIGLARLTQPLGKRANLLMVDIQDSCSLEIRL